MENFDASNQNLSFFQYPQQNYTILNQSNQQSTGFNYYNNAQNGSISHYNEGRTVAVVRSVIAVFAINERDKKPCLVNQESAFPSNNRTPNETEAMQSAFSIDQDDGISYYGNQQQSVDYNYNNQYEYNSEYGESMTPGSEEDAMSTTTSDAKTQPIVTELAPAISVNPADFPGELNFEFHINREDDRKKSFVYSKLLRKVFIGMKKTLPVQFSWRNYPSNLRIRACMIFKDTHSRDKPVQRCLAHKASDLKENECVEPLRLRFTFRTNQWGSFYQEDAKGFLSVVTPTGPPNPGRDHFQVDYQYFCMTSCVTGINRRATFLVFTLEDESGRVLGRRSLPIQICSCPKRDMEKEEGRTLNPDPSGEKKSVRSRKVEKVQGIAQPAQWTAQSVTPYLPQPTAYLPKPTSNFAQSYVQSQATSYFRQAASNFSAQPTQMQFGYEEDEVFDLNLKILGAEEYLRLLDFTYRLLWRDGQENNKFDKHREVLNCIRQKIDEFKRTNFSLS